MTKETKAFQAETKELLDLMIHSLYSHREVFLRELISNASDAIEKLKFESLTQSSLSSLGTSFEINLETNPSEKTVSITDNGIGMTYDEVLKNIGTIAHSGTKSFLKMRNELKEHPELIGQFGVGFYSAFMVADRVTVHTQKAGTQAGTLWESDGSGTFTVEEKNREKGNGTTVTLHLKDFKDDEEAMDFTDANVLRRLVKKYSDFVAYPIKLKDETLNSQKALWLKSPSEITQQEYSDFYKHLTHDWAEPLKTIHYKAEGTMEFASILYIPAQKPFDYDFGDRKSELNLYAKRVFIKGNCEELIPPYLKFVRGLVDSDDLSLNVSRELLQQDRHILRIRKALTGKVLSTLKDLLDSDRTTYLKFWNAFGSTLKEGIASEPASRDKLENLLLFQSTSSNELTTLREYVTRMKPSQKAIYFILGESLSQIQNSLYLEKLRSKGLEVLLLTDRIDTWVTTGLTHYDDKPLQSITDANLDLNDEEEKQKEEAKLKDAEAKYAPLMGLMKETLKGKVEEVKISTRLLESPVCLVSSEGSATAHLERLLKSVGQTVPEGRRILEINPDHPVFDALLNTTKPQQEEWTEILYQQALLNEGSQIPDPLKYSQQIAKLMLAAYRKP